LAKHQPDAVLDMLNGEPHYEETKEVLVQAMITNSPTFQNWNIIISMYILYLMSVQVQREHDFPFMWSR
jgi:hypothetical protein